MTTRVESHMPTVLDAQPERDDYINLDLATSTPRPWGRQLGAALAAATVVVMGAALLALAADRGSTTVPAPASGEGAEGNELGKARSIEINDEYLEKIELGSGVSAGMEWTATIRPGPAQLASEGYCLDVVAADGGGTYCTENTDGRFAVAYQSRVPQVAIVQAPADVAHVEATWPGGSTGPVAVQRPFADAGFGLAVIALPAQASTDDFAYEVTSYDSDGQQLDRHEMVAWRTR